MQGVVAVLQVLADRPGRDAELVRDLLVRHTRADQAQALALSLGQRWLHRSGR